ncbi:MAG: T9SS type A sorting domain-containing protein, partial [Saprospiraceae bacterium]|nr:T9SS type A sorting domain-containing protein [Saprospiraceae bacterium]
SIAINPETNHDLGVDDYLNVSVYPNPATENVSLTVGGVHVLTLVYIYDVNGKIIWQDSMEHTHDRIEVELSAKLFAPGVYTVYASNSYETSSEKLVVIR